ncbi:MAG: hypothetical protein HXS41_07115 [Theionarchaea archaeon]|nr:hypothetical protein [Theionarchaea archaeon]
MVKFHLLFKKAYCNYSLYHVRTPEFYQQLLIKRPNVGLKNILVAERDNGLTGFAAFGVKDLGSATIISIYEVSTTDEESFHALMSGIQHIGTEKRCAYLETMAPPQGNLASQLTEEGYSRIKDMITMGYPITVRRILNLFVERALSKGMFRKNVKIAFDVNGEHIVLTLPEGTLENGTEGDLLIQTSACVLLELLFRRAGILISLIKGKVVVRPLRCIVSAREVIEYLAEEVRAITPYTELT